MRTNRLWLQRTARLGLLLVTGASLNACAGSYGPGGTTWKEKVQLHDGTKIVATRTVERGGRHEIGQEPPIKAQTISFALPGTNESVVWHDEFDKDVGSASFLPAMLEVRDGTAYLVAHPMGCLSYNKWGRPNPPYVVFRYRDGAWSRIALQELPNELKTPNLISSSPDEKARQVGGGVVSAEAIRALYDGYRQPEDKTIVRERLAKERCPQYPSGPKAPIPMSPSRSPN